LGDKISAFGEEPNSLRSKAWNGRRKERRGPYSLC